MSLRVEHLSKDYPTRSGPLSVLRDVNLELQRGEALAVMGPSGSGKSTLLHILGTLDRPTAGAVRLDGKDPFALSEPELADFRNRHVGFVFQDHYLLPQCSVLENVLIPTLVSREDRGQAEAWARQLLERVGLAQRLDHRPAELSGGERQRVAVARALVLHPVLLLADEPTGNLDRRTARAVGELLLELHREQQTILVVVTHSAELARQLPRQVEMGDGTLGPLDGGALTEIQKRPARGCEAVMSFFRLLLRNLFYHWRGNSAVLLGVAVGTAVLTGALLVGDSLRGSLRDLTEKQLDWVGSALVAGRFVREDLAREIASEDAARHVEPALILQGAASTVPPDGSAELSRRVGRITVYGVGADFWGAAAPISGRFWNSAPPFAGGPAGGRASFSPGVVLNAALANDLGVKAGDTIALHVQKASGVPRETLLGRRDEQAVLARLQFPVKLVIADDVAGGSFNLNPSPAAPRNAFVPLALLQDRLDLKGRVNALLASDGDAEALQVDLKKHLTLDDWGLLLRTPAGRTDDLFRKLDRNGDGKLQRTEWGGRLAEEVARWADADGDGVLTREEVLKFYRERRGYVSLESRQLLIEAAAGDAALAAAGEAKLRAAPTLVYLANTIRVNGQEIPYSVVAALQTDEREPLGPLALPKMNNPLDAGEPLSVQGDEILFFGGVDLPPAKPGDEVTLTYFEPVEGGQLYEKQAKFHFKGSGLWYGSTADPDLTPEFPGITDKLDIRDWDPPFPYDNKRIKPRDEQYWKKYRTTPKAYISLAKGQELWGSRFGKLTSVRLAPQLVDGKVPAADLEALAADYSRRLQEHLDPSAGGFVFDAVRQRALAAGAGGNDFGGLFLGFSCFLIVAALLLVGLLFRLNLDRRASEIGLLMATGFRRRTVFWLLLGEGAILAAAGGALGLLLAVGYARLLLDLLRLLWPGGLERSILQLHDMERGLALGFVSAFLVSLGTIAWAMLALRKVPPRALLAGETVGQVSNLPSNSAGWKPAPRRWSLWVAVGCAIFGLALLPLGPFVHDAEMRASTFFGSGLLLLVAALAGVWAWMRSARHGQVGGRGGTALAKLGVRNAARHPVRSLLTAGLLASAAFLLVAVESFRRSAGGDFLAKDAGSGGYALVAESDVPIYEDLNGDKGRAEIGDALERRLHDPERLKEAQSALAGVSFQQFRARRGDDASCLNLYQPRKPRLLGVPAPLIDRGGFRFAATTTPAGRGEKENPWRMLDRDYEDGTIPVIGEANTVKWMLHGGLGREIGAADERGAPVKLLVVGLLSDSVFQSGLLMSEKHFLKLYPSEEGYKFFLVESPPGRAGEVKAVLETALGDRGFEVTPSARRLEAYLAVENMYLTTFQMLGGLGLLLGTLGLAVVLLRSVWERRGELALLRALGYRHRALGWLLLAENGFLLLLGLGAGAATALLAVAPHLAGGEGAVPWPELLGMLAAVLLVGLLTAAAALAATLRAPLVPALRRE